MVIIDEALADIQVLDAGRYSNKIAALDILRLDKIHSLISGNKWYKLKGNLELAIEGGYSSLLSFGGPYSNHLAATAAAAAAVGLNSVGIVRGLHASERLTPTLQQCKAMGMSLHYFSRGDYANKESPALLNELSRQYPDALIIPEGGADEAGKVGAASIANLIPHYYTHICLSAGTGTTLCGVRNGLPRSAEVLGFVPLKGGRYLRDAIAPGLNEHKPFVLFDDWHFGGFGKWTDELISFMNFYYEKHGLPLDIVYTSKMMYGIEALITSGYFPASARILCIHTGGLQGNASVRHLLSF